MLTVLHRWLGLVMVGFLVVTGLTGSLLAWTDELEVAIRPAWHRAEPPSPDSPRIDPLVLRERLAQQYPGAEFPTVWLSNKPGRSVAFFLVPATDTVTGTPRPLESDQLFVDPYTGRVLGERRWGDIGQGVLNVVPFVYRLHHALALGEPGRLALGVVALLWTLDCFIGAWLTLPARRRAGAAKSGWWSRWRPAWQVRWRAAGHRRTFDLHRAGGLWLWAMLFVFAWSSVAFNLTEVYHPVMRAAFDVQAEPRDLPTVRDRHGPPALDWFAARDTARRLMAERARQHRFQVLNEDWMFYDAARRIYRYDVTSTLDLDQRNGGTRVHLDADTGELRGVWLPTGRASGDTVYTWLSTLHTASMWGWPLQLLVCGMGLAVAGLGITGVMIWVRKRRGRRARGRA